MADELWQEAFRNQLSKLKSRERKKILTLQATFKFNEDGMQDLLQPLQTKYESSKFQAMLERTGRIACHILSFGKGIDIAIGGGHLAVGMIWGGVRILLELSSASSDLLEGIFDMLESLSLYLPLVQDWTELFPSSEHVELAQNLKKTCSVFTEYLVNAILFLQRPALVNMARLLFHPSFQSQFIRSRQLIDNYTRHIDRLVTTAAIKCSRKNENHIIHAIRESTKAPVRSLPISFPFRFLQNCIRNDLFFGRDEQMGYLDAILSQRSERTGIQSVVIHGLGGSGKSSLAKEYMYRQMDKYSVILWIYADNTTKLDCQFLTLARMLGILSHENQARESVLHWINNLSGHFLIVFDNADNPAILSSCWPNSKQGSVIITSNNPTTREEGYAQHGVTTEAFDNETGAKFLSFLLDDMVLDSEDISAVSKLSQQYDGLPLCLRQAALFMRSKKCSPSQFLELYQSRYTEIDTFPIPNYSKNVVTVWDMSMSMLSSESLILLDLLALLDPDSIPLTLFHPKEIQHAYGTFMQDQMHVLDAIQGLLSQSFVEFNQRERTLRIHRFFRMANFRKLHQNAERFHNILHLATELIQKHLPEDKLASVRQPERWTSIEKIMNHTFSIHRQAESTDSVPIPATLLQCLSDLVNYGFETGQYALGEEAFQKAQLMIGRVYSLDSVILARLYHYHSRICAEECRTQDMLESAECAYKYFIDAVARNPDLYQSTLHRSVLSGLGMAHIGMEQYEKAEHWLLQIIGTCVRLGKDEEWSLGNLTQNLANCYLWSGDIDKAESTVRLALKQPNKNTEAAKYTLGNIMLRKGEYEQALSLHKEALEIYCDTMGPDHLTSSDSWHKIGCILSIPHFVGKDLKEAENSFREALRIVQLPANSENTNSEALIARIKWRLSDLLGSTQESQIMRSEAMTYLETRTGCKTPLSHTAEAFDSLVFYYSR